MIECKRYEVRSADGKLLFVYDAASETIEIVRRGVLFCISLVRLRDDLDRGMRPPYVVLPEEESPETL